MFGADENCREGHDGPRQAAETCSMVEFMHSFEMLAKITGDPLWADRCEDVAFNSFPASRTPDLKGLHYLTAPNMVRLDRGNKSPGLQNKGCMLAYDPHLYRCCQHNVSQGWPYYAEELWLATSDNGLCASLYAPSKIRARAGDGTEVIVECRTDYPFRETVAFTIAPERPVRFPIYLRIPDWCGQAKISVNGGDAAGPLRPRSYAVIEKTWNEGDTVALTLPMPVRVKTWEKNRNTLSVHRGPLAFSLRIGEKWVRNGGTDAWPAFDVLSSSDWNYGLLLNPKEPTASFEVIEIPGPIADEPFIRTAAPVELRVKARKLPAWKEDDLGLVGEVPTSPAESSEPVETVTLVPMGCARLRISAFPWMKILETERSLRETARGKRKRRSFLFACRTTSGYQLVTKSGGIIPGGIIPP
jgi:hypothetical protein